MPLISSNSKHYIKIIDGKSKELIHSWKGLPNKRNNGNDTRYVTSCEIVSMRGEKPMVFISLYWRTKNWIARSDQYVFFHNGKRYINRKVNTNSSNSGFNVNEIYLKPFII